MWNENMNNELQIKHKLLQEINLVWNAFYI